MKSVFALRRLGSQEGDLWGLHFKKESVECVLRKRKSLFSPWLPPSLSPLNPPFVSSFPTSPPLSVFPTAKRFVTAGCDLTPPPTFSTTQKKNFFPPFFWSPAVGGPRKNLTHRCDLSTFITVFLQSCVRPLQIHTVADASL